MSNPFDFFDCVYCIHLPNEKRRTLIEKEFERVGITDRVKYIHAPKPPANFTMSNMRRNPRGEFGVNLSQIKAVVHAISDGAKTPLFLEDDVIFAKDAFNLLQGALESLPEDWDILYMGGHPTGPIFNPQAKKVSDTLAKVGNFSFADSYAFNENSILRFYDTWSNKITEKNAMYDIILGHFAGTNNAYCTYPLVCQQRPDISQVCGGWEDKHQIISRAWSNHYGDENITPEHKAVSDKWKKANPGRWAQIQQRKRTGK